MLNQNRWLTHGPMTDPKDMAPLVVGLPADIGQLCSIIQGILIHGDLLAVYELAEGSVPYLRDTLPLATRLRRVADNDPRPLTDPREPSARSVGTCRDQSLLVKESPC
jgi:hypothetical protein